MASPYNNGGIPSAIEVYSSISLSFTADFNLNNASSITFFNEYCVSTILIFLASTCDISRASLTIY